MAELLEQIRQDMNHLVEEWLKTEYLREGHVFIVGCSTSEVAGKHIGTAGSEEVAAEIWQALTKLQAKKDVALAFQCCEHLNRAIVMEQATQEKLGLDVVSAIPQPNAGGSMATYAFKQMNAPVLVEEVRAHAGIDIGHTLIGMQLKRVAVPLRFEQQYVGEAIITGARTRPKLIGGERAKYV